MAIIELGKAYSTKEVAELLGVASTTLKNKRDKYDEYLSLFFQFEKEQKGKAHTYYYTFTHSYNEENEIIPYREYKSSSLRKNIIKTIEKDNRQTGSNIARIIFVDNEIQALNLKLSTITTYVRSNLREMVEQGYYCKKDYRWCYLDEKAQVYKLMNEEEVAELRGYFKLANSEAEELYARYSDGEYTLKVYYENLGEVVHEQFQRGIYAYYEKHGYYPIKVAVYERQK